MIPAIRKYRECWCSVLLLASLLLPVCAASVQSAGKIESQAELRALNAELWGPHNVDEKGTPLRVSLHNANGERIEQLVKQFPMLNMVFVHPGKEFKAEDLRHLEHLTDLKTLWYSGFLTDDQAGSISRLTELKELSFSVRGRAEGRDLSVLRRLAQLEALRLGVGFDTYEPSEDEFGAAVIELFPQLKTLDLSHASVSDSTIRAACQIKSLRRLKLSGGAIVNSGAYRPLTQLVNLEVFELYLPRSDEAVAQLCSLSSLHEVEGLPDLTDNGMLQLANVTSLKRLHNLCSDRVTDQSLIHLGRLTELESLELHSPRILGSGFAKLKPLTKLKRLKLRHTGFEAKNIQFLLKFKALEELDLGWTRVGDDDLESLIVLKDLPNLKELSVELTEPNRLKLQEMLPNVTVTFLE